ncbi:hypothetical protein EDEG_02675 [Edhazardia aedis USNM 41457]|uniref:Uncharacterized protein n=1 Tax=Edhazardia aedis (strain USNM 41457) TaxID=1003232 RepID=J9D563_EDHAE|nr:hypothetical protein EDEG_02675 [Edhazardia aedis USNM 41457]|eukprot:EJW02946.1 hypothetical protein EDEG_02675 [Edhazardia aedis USNM 41457]
MTHFFIVFTRKGLVLYETGERPSYLNPFIKSIDTSKASFRRRVRDEFAFIECKFDKIYLGIFRDENIALFDDEMCKYEVSAGIKKEKIEDLEPNTNKENLEKNLKKTKSSTNLSSTNKKDSKPIKVSINKNRDKTYIDETENLTLDFSEKCVSSETVYKLEPIKQEKRKFTFNLFKKTIKKEDLRQKIETQLINKNISSEIAAKIVNDVLKEFGENVQENEFREKLRHVLKQMISTLDHEKLIKEIKNKRGIFVFVLLVSMALEKALRWQKSVAGFYKIN